ncbi:hypothetical protein RIR_jg3967.t1 [Rhizophagus irregularis DAOM 181602=DAOM 197198]|nr:hypothetical protein RIR_jg3967.t1 [Rhizophagus irregularis DAOM 181602=DAOM 197198]
MNDNGKAERGSIFFITKANLCVDNCWKNKAVIPIFLQNFSPFHEFNFRITKRLSKIPDLHTISQLKGT